LPSDTIVGVAHCCIVSVEFVTFEAVTVSPIFASVVVATW
jgi:hypothetical protein